MDMDAFRQLPLGRQGTDLLALPETERPRLLKKLKNEEVVSLLKHLDHDEAGDVLRSLTPRRRTAVVRRLSTDLQQKVKRFLSFHPHVAAGMMDVNYIQVPTSATYKDVAEDLSRHETLTGKFPVILAVDDGRLAGELHGHELIRGNPASPIVADLKPVVTVRADASEREVRSLFNAHPHTRLIVLDEDDSVLGVVFTDDILQALHSKESQSLYDFAGVRDEEDVHDPVSWKVRSRLAWLVINLGTGFLAAATVGLFEETISKTVVLAAYMPIVAGMGGNAGTQTLAVMVRGLAMKEIELRTGARVVAAEIGAGLVNGSVTGVIVAVVAALLNQNPVLGIVTGTAMAFNLMVAGCFGALVPMVMQRLGKDPATSATIFITTCTDVLGFFAFLGLASILL